MPSPRRSSGITLQSFYAANISASRNPRHRIHQILSRTTAHRSDRLTMQPDRPSFDHNPLLAAKLARNLAAVNTFWIVSSNLTGRTSQWRLKPEKLRPPSVKRFK
jgi:hypothetical protein